jgi:predicted RNA methylase
MAVLGKVQAKKELGQYFSGPALAMLLSELANAEDCASVLDPMCGTGDLLRACMLNKKTNRNITGIEIDEHIYEIVEENIGQNQGIQLIKGNAFSPKIIRQLKPKGYDLVIANPPYVRYQSTAGPDMCEIRDNLKKIVKQIQTLSARDKELFSILISKFSGLSDLAVPAWILCSLLVKRGGRMAMIVPETWMNRNYSSIVKYLLLRWFQVEYIVEDRNAAWFKPALIKTVLIVAKRISGKKSIFEWGDDSFTHASVFGNAGNGKSLVGNIFPSVRNPEKAFVQTLNKKTGSFDGYENRKIKIRNFAQDLINSSSYLEWFKILEPMFQYNPISEKSIKSSSALTEWVKGAATPFQSLTEMGVQVSQGLRTGANDFFYLKSVPVNEKELQLTASDFYQGDPFIVPIEYTLPVIRKQAELSDTYSLNSNHSKSVVLALQEYATANDLELIKKSYPDIQYSYKKISGDLNRYIQVANGYSFKDLTAVKPNIRKFDPMKKLQAPRFWYMLPPFTKRHNPDLFVPRINNSFPRTRINNDRQYLIDANFSTLWLDLKKDEIDQYFLLALLNSSWSLAAMEEYGTVMGGGALKLEATQIKKIPFPNLHRSHMKKLSLLGQELSITINPEPVLRQIDLCIVEGFGFKKIVEEKYQELKMIIRTLLAKRITR